jgi:hypothetical protein
VQILVLSRKNRNIICNTQLKTAGCEILLRFGCNSRLHTEVGSVSFLSRAKIVYQGVAEEN